MSLLDAFLILMTRFATVKPKTFLLTPRNLVLTHFLTFGSVPRARRTSSQM